MRGDDRAGAEPDIPVLVTPTPCRKLDGPCRDGVPLEIHHTSGHASVGDLQRLARALAPRRLVPIHSLAGHRFGRHFDHIDVQPDGVWWAV